MTNPLKFASALLIPVISACAATKAYHGPELPAAQLAEVRGVSTHCAGSYFIDNFDGEFGGTALRTPAGPHRMQVTRISAPFIGDGAQTPLFPICTQISAFDVSFETAAQRRYWFYSDDSIPNEAKLSVFESTGDGPAGKRIPAQAERLWSRRNCYVDDRFAGCFPG